MKSLIQFLVFIWFFTSCGGTDEVMNLNPYEHNAPAQNPNPTLNGTYTYLALGDSYTIGESVCATCNYPNQLKAAFESGNSASLSINLIAQTGWRTSNLMHAIEAANPSKDQDLVTLLIGVNNQYQGESLDTYKIEFKELLDTAVKLASGESNRVVVISIPDYAYTPFGQSSNKPETISAELNAFNEAAESITKEAQIEFLNITDITRRGLREPNLVAYDGLHPSKEAYAEFVERLLPVVTRILIPN